MPDENGNITVGFPLYQDCTLLDFAGATQVFTPFTGAGFRPIWLAMTDDPIETTEGVRVVPNTTFAKFHEAGHPLDVLLTPGGGGGVATTMNDPGFLAEIRRLAEPASWVGAVCTGAFILASAGLLDGHKATTYWSQLENLDRFPEVWVDLDAYPRRLIQSEDGGKTGVFTGGGISSSIDLALYLVQMLAGEETCRTVQLVDQYAPEPPFHSGDPRDAWPETTEKARKAQEGFTQIMREATDEAIHRMG